MKRIFLALSFCGSILLLSGCWDRTEINDMAIVTAAAIDKSENKQIELSIQVFIPRTLSTGGGSGGGGAGGGHLTLVRSGKGIDIADAMSKLQGKLPRKIFWGHCKVYLFGEDMAKEGIAKEIDFLVRHPEPRNRADIYVSKGRALDVLNIYPPLERYSSEVIRELSDLHIGMEVTLVDLRKMLRGEGGAAALPMIDIQKPKKGEEELAVAPYIFGTAIFKKDKMIGHISEQATRGVMWLTNEIQTTTVTVKDKHGVVSLNPIREDTKLIPKVENGKWKIIAKIKTEGDMVQNGTHLNFMNPQLLKIAEKALQKDIETRIELALRKVQKEMKADVFGFAQQFHRYYPQQWRKVKDHWDEVFPQVEVVMDIQAYIRRPGLATVPGGIPETEVKEK